MTYDEGRALARPFSQDVSPLTAAETNRPGRALAFIDDQ
jgi:hypothetical protein